MLLLSNRIKFCSLAFTAARLCSSGPAAANNNPTVYFDIAADNQPLGRVTFEVRRRNRRIHTACALTLLSCLRVNEREGLDVLSLRFADGGLSCSLFYF